MHLVLPITIVLCSFTFVAFTYVIAFGAPFLPTLSARTPEIFELLKLKPGQKLLELGSGDGRVLRAAAQRGIYAVGYELNPLLVMWSIVMNWRYRKYITVHWGNYWHEKLEKTDAIYVFLLNPYMKKLDTKIVQEQQCSILLVSFAFEIPNKKHATEHNGLFLYKYNLTNRFNKTGLDTQ